jgi:hypothetical protein
VRLSVLGPVAFVGLWRLRQAIGPAGLHIESRGPGYVLAAGPRWTWPVAALPTRTGAEPS